MNCPDCGSTHTEITMYAWRWKCMACGATYSEPRATFCPACGHEVANHISYSCATALKYYQECPCLEPPASIGDKVVMVEAEKPGVVREVAKAITNDLMSRCLLNTGKSYPQDFEVMEQVRAVAYVHLDAAVAAEREKLSIARDALHLVELQLTAEHAAYERTKQP